MRSAIAYAMLGTVGVAAVVAGNVYYAIGTSDTLQAATIYAAGLALVTVFGLIGHAVARDVWRSDWKLGISLACISGFALMVSLSNSLAFLKSKGAAIEAQASAAAISARDEAAELEALRARRTALPTHTPTTEDAVAVARNAVQTAATQREAECGRNGGGRGSRCREREADERAALDRLAIAERDRSVSASADEIDAAIAAIMARREQRGPIAAVNVQAQALAEMFGLQPIWAEWLARWQQAVYLIALELVTVALWLRAEHAWAHRKKPEAAEQVEPVSEPVVTGATSAIGAVTDWCAAQVRKNKASAVSVADAYDAYASWCHTTDRIALDPKAYADDLRDLVKTRGWAVRMQGDQPEIVGVRLVSQTRLIEAA